MKNIILLFGLLVILSSCGNEGDGDLATYKLSSLQVEAFPVPIIDGEAYSPQFTTIGEEVDYTLTLDSETLSWSTSGSYDLFTEFDMAMIPVIRDTYDNVTKEGNFSVLKNGYQFDQPIFDLEFNGLNWINTDGSEIKFILNNDGNKLRQEQSFQNIEVISGLNANITVLTIWELI